MITRTSRARILPFTRICSCRLDSFRRRESATHCRCFHFRISAVDWTRPAEHSTSPRLRRPHRRARNFASRGKVVATMKESQGESNLFNLWSRERSSRRPSLPFSIACPKPISHLGMPNSPFRKITDHRRALNVQFIQQVARRNGRRKRRRRQNRRSSNPKWRR